MTEFYDYFSVLRRQKGTLASALASSIIIQFLNFFMVIILAWRMELQVSLLQLAVFLPIVVTISSLPIRSPASVSGRALLSSFSGSSTSDPKLPRPFPVMVLFRIYREPARSCLLLFP